MKDHCLEKVCVILGDNEMSVDKLPDNVTFEVLVREYIDKLT